jgi:ComF family protein
MKTLWISAFIDLFYPNLCSGCGNPLLQQEHLICTRCRYELPLSHYADNEDNPVEKAFWGRINLQHASSMYNFQKKTCLQSIIHEIKYKGRDDLGLEMGRWMGQAFQNTAFGKVDALIPIPLHKKREQTRGYNQSTLLCRGIAEIWNIPVCTDAVIRAEFTSTQTHKGRFSRWQNVEHIFKLNNISHLEGKHLLLIDDVITTGATIEACASQLLEIKDVKLSVLALAKA